MGEVADFSWVRLFLAFFVVLAGLGGLGFVLRYVASRGLMMPMRGGRVRRLQIVESLTVDAKRRMIIVSCDGREHLLLLNGSRDIVVEANLQRENP